MESDSIRYAKSDNIPLVVILGETATGKTALALELARYFDGEIIAADSRTVYRGMDIGTAKPSITERQEIRHFGLDVVEPDESFNVYSFKLLAQKAIRDIGNRNKLAIMVGGTGLYLDAVLFDFSFRSKPSYSLRELLETLSVSELQSKVLAAGLPLPQNVSNPRHLIRLLEGGSSPLSPRLLRPNTFIIGLTLQRDDLYKRIDNRVVQMMNCGLLDEAQMLYERYGDIEALRTPGYRALIGYIKGEVDLDSALQQFVRADLLLAKKQRTWFKRNKSIHWLSSLEAKPVATALITTFLNT